jgi:hypothetical protein
MTRIMHGTIRTWPPAMTAAPDTSPAQNGMSRMMKGVYIAPAISATLGQLWPR